VQFKFVVGAKNAMEYRIIQSIETWLGCAIDDKSNGKIHLLSTSSRTDAPYNRLVINRIVGKNVVIATCIPRLVDKLTPLLDSITEWELFSEYGLALLRNHMSSEDAQYLGQGLSYAKIQTDNFLEECLDFVVRKTNENGLVVGFVYVLDDIEVSSVELSRRDSSDTIFINVETKKDYRGKGFGTCVVKVATDWLLTNGFVPRYGAGVSNTASLSIARKLQYNLISHHIVC
jgi:GNAT superfamily N-acetyltransferase